MPNIVRDVREAVSRYFADDGGLMAAAVAYYAALTFFPVLLVSIAIVGFFLRFTDWGTNAEAEVLNILAAYSSPQLTEQVATALGRIEREAVLGARWGVLGLLITTGGLFIQFEKAFDRIWNVDRPPSRGMLHTVKSALLDRLQAFAVLLVLGGLLFLTTVASVTSAAIQRWTNNLLPASEWLWSGLNLIILFALNALVFTLLYRYLSKVPVGWRPAAKGGLFAAAIWEAGRWVLAAMLIGPKASVYGVVGALLAVMLWAYYSSVVIFLGAELVQVYCGYRRDEKIPLKPSARPANDPPQPEGVRSS